jgi:hypothetical protein
MLKYIKDMRKKEMVEVEVIYCDFCNAKITEKSHIVLVTQEKELDFHYARGCHKGHEEREAKLSQKFFESLTDNRDELEARHG